VSFPPVVAVAKIAAVDVGEVIVAVAVAISASEVDVAVTSAAAVAAAAADIAIAVADYSASTNHHRTSGKRTCFQGFLTS